MTTLFKRGLPLAALLPAIAGAAEQQSLDAPMPSISIDYSGVAAAVFEAQGGLLAATVPAAVALMVMLFLVLRPRGATVAAASAAADRVARVWAFAYVVLLSALALVGMRVWLLLQA
jgi:hypothetical protein